MDYTQENNLFSEVLELIKNIEDRTDFEKVKNITIELFSDRNELYYILRSVKKEFIGNLDTSIRYENNNDDYNNITERSKQSIKKLVDSFDSLSPSHFNNLKDGFLQKSIPSIFKSNKDKYKEKYTLTKENINKIELELLQIQIDLNRENSVLKDRCDRNQANYDVSVQHFYFLKNLLNYINSTECLEVIGKELYQMVSQDIISNIFAEIEQESTIVIQAYASLIAINQIIKLNNRYLSLIAYSIKNARMTMSQIDLTAKTAQFDEKEIENLNNLIEKVVEINEKLESNQE